MAHRDFNAARAESAQADPDTFDLGYQQDGTPRTWTVGRVPASMLFDMAEKAELADADALLIFRGFLAAIVVPDQRDEFLAMLADSQLGASMGELFDIVQWVISEQTGRPFVNPSSSPL